MRTIVILAFFLSSNLNLFAQELNVEQTLSYINRQLNSNDNKQKMQCASTRFRYYEVTKILIVEMTYFVEVVL